MTDKPSMRRQWANSGEIIDPGNAKVDEGWIAEKPPYQHENWVQNRSDEWAASAEERGVPAWDTQVPYQANALCHYGSKIWFALQAHTGQQPGVSQGYWKDLIATFGEYLLLNGTVPMTGNLTIEKVEPVIALKDTNPGQTQQNPRVDFHVSGERIGSISGHSIDGGLDDTKIRIRRFESGGMTQMIEISKSEFLFQGAPSSSTNQPVASSHLTRKDYVDDGFLTNNGPLRAVRNISSTDLDTITDSGFYRLNGDTPNNPTNAGSLLLSYRDNDTNRNWQNIITGTTPVRSFTRYSSDGGQNWGDWREVAHTDYVDQQDATLLPLNGSRQMIGNLEITKSAPAIDLNNSDLSGVNGSKWRILIPPQDYIEFVPRNSTDDNWLWGGGLRIISSTGIAQTPSATISNIDAAESTVLPTRAWVEQADSSTLSAAQSYADNADWQGATKFVSTSAPTSGDGKNGDIWFQYE